MFVFVVVLVGRLRGRGHICMTASLMCIGLLGFSLAPPLREEVYYPAAAGDIVVIPINPEGWSLKLTKKE